MTAGGKSALSERIGAIPKLDPAAPALEFDGRWYTWGQLDTTISSIGALVPEPGTQLGIILRNRPAHVGALLGVLRAGGCVVTINPQRGRLRTQKFGLREWSAGRAASWPRPCRGVCRLSIWGRVRRCCPGP